MLAETAHPRPTPSTRGAARVAAPGDRPADSGTVRVREDVLRSLLAAFGIFIAGAGFSVFEGVLALRHGPATPLIAYLVLAVSAVTEGTSWSG